MADPAANNWPAPPAEQPVGPTLTNSIPVISSGRWQSGITYTPECPEGETLSLYVRGVPKTATDRPEAVTWIPYILKFYEQCSTFSGVTEEDISRAKRGLRAVSEQLLGAELWNGVISQSENWQGDPTPNTWLSDDTNMDILSSGTGVGYVQALSCLNQYLTTTNAGQQGVIHATAQLITYWDEFGLLHQVGDQLFTVSGHLVIASPGYPGDGPNGPAADDDVWAYATDMIRIFMEEPRVNDQLVQIVDRENNTTAIMAERRALAEWPRCRHAGIQVAVSVCGIGGAY